MLVSSSVIVTVSMSVMPSYLWYILAQICRAGIFHVSSSHSSSSSSTASRRICQTSLFLKIPLSLFCAGVSTFLEGSKTASCRSRADILLS